MTVTNRTNCGSTAAIEILPAIGIVEVDALGPFDRRITV